MTHREMVLQALNSPDFDGLFDIAITNDDIRSYIREAHNVTVSTGEISDIRQAEEEEEDGSLYGSFLDDQSIDATVYGY